MHVASLSEVAWGMGAGPGDHLVQVEASLLSSRGGSKDADHRHPVHSPSLQLGPTHVQTRQGRRQVVVERHDAECERRGGARQQHTATPL